MNIDRKNLRLILGRTAPRDATSLTATESLNAVPTYIVEYANETKPIAQLLGEKAEILLPEEETGLGITPRRFCGVVTAAELTSDESSATTIGGTIRLTVRPFLALLSYSTRCYVHQNKSSVDILKDILEFNGLKRSPVRIKVAPPRREICVQYNEDDLSFVTRILAEDGIAFFFGDGKDADVLVTHDSARPFPDIKGGVIALTDASVPRADRLRADNLRRASRAATGKVALTSYDIERAAQNASRPEPVSKVPGMKATADKSHLAVHSGALQDDEQRRRAAERRAAAELISGQCNHPAIHLGQAMNITSQARDIAGDYVVSQLEYRVGGDHRVHLSFNANPRANGPVPMRPAKPVIAGVHNAVVVGGDAGTAVQDAQGRVKVRFLWDSTDAPKDSNSWLDVAEQIAGDDFGEALGPIRSLWGNKNKADDKSCWLRVATPIAGNGYGALFTPRAGQEVLVSFLNGDPDAPVITGNLYNSKHAHPYMEEGGTRSGVTTKLSQELANELEFEDKEGSEKLSLRAAKDLDVVVTEAASTTIGTTETRQISDAASHEYGTSLDINVAENAMLKAETITLQAQSRLVLQVGSSQIELTPSGVTITGGAVKIDATTLEANASAQFNLSGSTGTVEASGPLNLKGLQLTAEGSATATVKAGGMMTVQASGMTTVKGAIVQIN